MGYTEDEQQAYSELQWKMEEFKSFKAEVRKMKCSIHKKKLNVSDSWEDEYALNIHISQYCCAEFANEIKALFINADKFDEVIIEPLK